jgi:hypothetical protein
MAVASGRSLLVVDVFHYYTSYYTCFLSSFQLTTSIRWNLVTLTLVVESLCTTDHVTVKQHGRLVAISTIRQIIATCHCGKIEIINIAGTCVYIDDSRSRR